LLLLAATGPAAAEDAPAGVKGLFLLTDYPAVTVRPGTASTINIRLQNYALPPERLSLSVSGVPSGWTATLLGGGQPVAAAMPATNQSVSLQLRVDVPANAAMGTQTLTINAKGSSSEVSLPVNVTLAKELPAKLTLEPQLPSLRGNAKSSFEYQLNVKNDSGRNLVVGLAASGPPNFETSFTEQYGSQEINSIPVEAGQSKTVKLKVRPPSTIGAGTYPVSVKATAEDATADAKVALEIAGQPRLSLSGRDGVQPRRGRQGNFDPDHHHQHRHGAGRRSRTNLERAERLEDRVRAEDDRPHPARPEQGSPGPRHPAGEGGGGRLCANPQRGLAR
jgi:uncharacterized membrane protein